MALWDKLMRTGAYLRRLRLSLGPDSYFQYKRRREQERADSERGRDQARDSAERDRARTERRRGYEDRYTAERESDQ